MLNTLKIVSEASVGAIFKCISAFWPPGPPPQGGTKKFIRSQKFGFDQNDNVITEIKQKICEKKVCLIKSGLLFTKTDLGSTSSGALN